VVKVFKWKRRVVGFTAVAKKRSFRVLLLFGGDQVEKLWNVAKCNLGKVKIEPMLVAGCVLWSQRITPKCMCYDAGWSQGFGASPSLAWLLACVFANCLSVLIVADH